MAIELTLSEPFYSLKGANFDYKSLQGLRAENGLNMLYTQHNDYKGQTIEHSSLFIQHLR